MVMYMKLFIRTLLIFLALVSLDARAALKAYVDRNPVAIDESLTLTLESDTKVDGRPDFSILTPNFEVLNQSSSTSVQFANGAVSRLVKWQVNLIPKREGRIQIPAFQIDSYASQPFVLNVTASHSPQAGQAGEPLFMEAHVDKKDVFVQQQVVLTLQFYRSVNIAGSSLSDLDVSGVDAIVEQLGDDREYHKDINGRRHVVFERKYVIYPQESGTLNIGAMAFDVNVIDQSRSNRFDPFGRNAVRKRVHSTPLKLNVKPVPSGMVGNWLPARKLELAEKWSSDKFIVGEPVTRTIGVVAHGLTAAQLPDVMGNTPDNVKVYPDQPIMQDSQDTQGIIGARQQKLAIIPTQTGKLTLPEIRLPWWNTETQKIEVAKLPKRTVTVVAAPKDTLAPTPTPLPQEESTEAQIGSETQQTPAQSAATVTVISPGWWPWVSLALGIAWLLTFIAWWRKGSSKPKQKKAKKSDFPAMRVLEGQLKQSCLNNSAVQAKQCLLEWAKQCWRNSNVQTPTSLTSMAKLCDKPLADLLVELDAALYANKQAEWKGAELWSVFSQNKPKPVVGYAKEESGLESLYRS